MIDSVSYKVNLLKQFYTTMRTDSIKWELKEYGFDFLDTFKRANLKLEYGELKGEISKYKLSNITRPYMDYMLKTHVEKDSNVCIYYGDYQNSFMSFNFDDNYKQEGTSEELKSAVYTIRKHLNEFDIEPLIYLSGRGYHMSVGFDKPIDNKKLQYFMGVSKIINKGVFKNAGLDTNSINIPIYPNAVDNNAHSLRLFGSEHIKNKMFSHVCTPEGVLNELDSWDYFEDYLNTRIVSKEHFEQVYKEEFEDLDNNEGKRIKRG